MITKFLLFVLNVDIPSQEEIIKKTNLHQLSTLLNRGLVYAGSVRLTDSLYAKMRDFAALLRAKQIDDATIKRALSLEFAERYMLATNSECSHCLYTCPRALGANIILNAQQRLITL